MPVNTAAQLQEQVARYWPGNKINVGYLRGNEQQTTTATLLNATNTTAFVHEAPEAVAVEYQGAKLNAKPCTEPLAKRTRYQGGRSAYRDCQ